MDKRKESRLRKQAQKMFDEGVDFRIFHNTFFGPDSELLAGMAQPERAQLIKSALYKELQKLANELGIMQGYLVREPDSKTVKERKYSGSFVLRLPVTLHRTLAVEAQREGVSLNQLCMAKLARSLDDFTYRQKGAEA